MNHTLTFIGIFHSLSLQEPAHTSVISTDCEGSENALTNQDGLKDESRDCNTYRMARIIHQSILFLIKRYIINALSAVQWNTHISLNTYIYIYSEIQHTYKHSYKAAISAQIQCFFISFTHTLTLVDVVSGPCLPYSW